MADRFPRSEDFVRALEANQSDEELRKIGRYFKSGKGEYGEGDRFIGVRMGTVFALAKEHVLMPLDEIEKLLDSDIHEARAGAVSIMAKQFGLKKTTQERRGELAALYLRRHDRINNWDLVDLGAPQIVGVWLRDRDRSVLYTLARSENLWERRTAMLATMAFARKGDLDDVFAIAEILVHDPQDLINKVVGGVLRETERSAQERLRAFLDRHADTMPRVALRYAIEHFSAAERAEWLKRGK
ncbi:DNA alkylation repair protein [Devosia riboflavina]|uniref:DNA alkylation repair protein n=1 Tax=Devosia riboflavina TaxID=46914 RepID=A0A087LZ36_9HYPH|nr:DNA alkylation repair protein [Devosia riboflavina]KFL29889.1 DNA alkylation repair protein [Devosia riboflavina]